MRLSHSPRFTLLLALAFVVAACGSDSTAPQKAPVSTATGTAGAVFSTPSDTTPLASGPAIVRGTVILITVTPSNGQPVDTSHTSPLAGARLSLSLRTVENGTVLLKPYGETLTDASGAFSFGEVPSGYYVLKGQGPVGTTYPAAQAYIATSVGEIVVNFRLVSGM